MIKAVFGSAFAFRLLQFVCRRLPYSLSFAVAHLGVESLHGPLAEAHWSPASLRYFPDTKLHINAACGHARLYSLCGWYEHHLSKQLLDLKRTGLLVDVGANYGYYSALWLRKSPRNRVIAVEPTPEYARLIERNLGFARDRYSIYEGCLGEDDGVVTLDTQSDPPTMLSKVVPDDGRPNLRRVRMTTLPNLMDQLKEKDVEILKVDTEGYDLIILQSAIDLFRRGRIHTVFWEPQRSSEERDFESALVRMGYARTLDRDALGYTLRSEGV